MCDNNDERAAKRSRSDSQSELPKNMNFKLTFEDPSVFTQMMTVAGNVLQEIELCISSDPNFSGVSIKSIDTKQVCMVIARVECAVSTRPGMTSEELTFRIKTGSILTCLKTVPSNYMMTLSQYEGDPSIHIKSTDGESFNDEVSFCVSTLVTHNNPPVLNNLEYDFNINMDLVTLKTLVKMCKDLKADDVVFQVMNIKQECATDSQPKSYFTVKASGEDVKIERKFVSMHTVHDEDASIVQSVSQCNASKTINEDLYDTRCSESFSTEYLSMFIKSMEKSTVNLRLSNKKPLLLNCELDNNQSMVCFILAPRDD